MKTICFCCLIMISSASCSTVKVFSNYDKYADFTKYVTFQLSAPNNLPHGDPILNKPNQKMLRKAITNQMLLRGYQPSTTPDIAVNIYMKIKPKTTVLTSTIQPKFPYSSYYRFYGHRGYYNYWGLGLPNAATKIREYKEGTLVIDLIDTNTDQMLWHGVAVGSLEDISKNPEAKIKKAVKKIFNEYPYTAGTYHSVVIKL